ncbi:MAG TPA: hypothetical protein VE693_07600 [Gaiellaceae bacterium]|nr:hypothetical protein [Gaiellaceae bacterium]
MTRGLPQFENGIGWVGAGMPLLLVDDRDGRVVAELESQEQALRLVESLDSHDPQALDYLCIVEFHDRPGAILGTESSVTIRTR